MKTCPIKGCTRRIIVVTAFTLPYGTVQCGGCHEEVLCDLVTCEQFKLDNSTDLAKAS